MPVVAVSASVMPADQSKISGSGSGSGSGFDAFVPKPISLKPFMATVERFIRDGRTP